jgi:23S rRNA (guanosine2251-2'-O)-methyltransferase
VIKGRRRAAGNEELIYGRNSVLEAARAGRVLRALVRAGLDPDPRLAELRRLVPVEEVPAPHLETLAEGKHQGVVAWLRSRSYLTLAEVVALQPSLLVALDGIEDPQNLGAILRSAEVAGAQAAILPDRRSAPLGAAAIKASSGASELVPICRVSGLAAAIPALGRAGVWSVALDPRAPQLAWEVDLTQPICLVVGSEGKGLHRLVRARCELALRLPGRGRVASLNASAAAAAVLYEVARQRIEAERKAKLGADMAESQSPPEGSR